MKKKENLILLTKEEKSKAVEKLKSYLEENFDLEVGNLQADIFLDYITTHMGVAYYNRGVADSMSFVSEKVEDMYLIMKDAKE